MPFVNLAVVPEFGSSCSVPARIGHIRAAELILLGLPFDARRAADLGFVTQVVPDQNLLATATETARKLAAKPAGALQASKRLMKRPFQRQIKAAMKARTRSSARSFARKTQRKHLRRFWRSAACLRSPCMMHVHSLGRAARYYPERPAILAPTEGIRPFESFTIASPPSPRRLVDMDFAQATGWPSSSPTNTSTSS